MAIPHTKKIGIITRATVQTVVTTAARQSVIALGPLQNIVARKPRELIITPVSHHRIVQLIACTIDSFLPELDRCNGIDGITTGNVHCISEGSNINKARHVADHSSPRVSQIKAHERTIRLTIDRSCQGNRVVGTAVADICRITP